MSNTFLILGLGNPGGKYENTRHNIGHMVLDMLADWAGARFQRHRKATAEVIEGHIGVPGKVQRVILAKNGTYMNTSGGAAAQLANYYDVPAENVIVVHDEIDTVFGSVKVKLGGGEGGHNGLKDISKALGTKDYLRVRVGVGRPSGGKDTADYVLSPFTAAERKVLADLVTEGAKCAEFLVENGLLSTQQEFHSKPPIQP